MLILCCVRLISLMVPFSNLECDAALFIDQLFMRMTQAVSVAVDAEFLIVVVQCADIFEHGLFGEPFEGLVTAQGTAS